tara:strand:+ start:1473 stop:2738 length:1266 start_codon:yes stop_codon:yes gene_type:complete
MSGSIAAIAAYDGTGTQGYGTTDKNLPGVKSVFWNEKDTDEYYVNGCSFSEVSSNKGEITSPETIVFTFDNDSDAINDLTLVIERTGPLTPGNDTVYHYMLYFIDRIEACVGNQVICAINTVQLIKDFLNGSNGGVFNKFVDEVDAQGRRGFTQTAKTTTTGETAAQRINLNIFRMLSNNGMDSSYLMSCANNQTLQIKVYPKNLTQEEFNAYTDTNSSHNVDGMTNPKFKFSLYANKYSMTNAERDFLRNQVVAKRTNITQFSELTSTAKPSGTLKAGSSITINCDHFNLYASSLSIVGLCHQTKVLLGGFDVELYLNSTSFSGIIPYSIADHAPALPTPDPNHRHFLNYLIPISKNAHMTETDQSYVPFSKYDSIRVILTAKKDITVSTFQDFFDTLTVVAEGKCTALYQDGAVVFNTY